MNISIKTINCELSTDSEGVIDRKFSLLEQHVRDGEAARLEVEVEGMPEGQEDGARFRADANLTIDGKLYRAVARSGSLEAAVEKVRHELETEVSRARKKQRSLLKRGGTALKNMLRFGR